MGNTQSISILIRLGISIAYRLRDIAAGAFRLEKRAHEYHQNLSPARGVLFESVLPRGAMAEETSKPITCVASDGSCLI